MRVNNGSTFDQVRGVHRKKNKWEDLHGTKLDIFVFLPDGKNCWIEVKKNEKEKATPGQLKFIETTIKNNGIAFVAWTTKQVREQLSDYFKR